MVGGAMWKIGKDEEEDIVYAIDYNHKKERSESIIALLLSLPLLLPYPPLSSPLFLPPLSLSLSLIIRRHLDGALLESLSRPHLLITGAYNALSVQARRKERDQALLSQ